jgi:hypothetical protein
VEAQAVCSARGDANSHGNDDWENDHEVRSNCHVWQEKAPSPGPVALLSH